MNRSKTRTCPQRISVCNDVVYSVLLMSDTVKQLPEKRPHMRSLVVAYFHGKGMRMRRRWVESRLEEGEEEGWEEG